MSTTKRRLSRDRNCRVLLCPEADTGLGRAAQPAPSTRSSAPLQLGHGSRKVGAVGCGWRWREGWVLAHSLVSTSTGDGSR